jgi:class 3 adenylate cyclase/CheY-like chemotaxis protein/HAMP domain-containing protein
MPNRVLILHSDLAAGQILSDFFTQRGDQVWRTTNPARAKEILAHENPTLALIDLHLPENIWMDILSRIEQDYHLTRVIVTNQSPDIRLELLAKEHGARIFLRAPFTAEWITRALNKLEETVPIRNKPATDIRSALPRVRVPMRIKITLPFVLLALAFLAASAYLVGRYAMESMQERFTNQLIDAGKLSADWMVQKENQILETVRLVAHTEGVSESILTGQSEQLRRIALPIAINSQEEVVNILDTNGISLLSLYHRPGDTIEAYEATRGDTRFIELDFVQKILTQRSDFLGDKFAGVAQSELGETFYISGPIFDANGKLCGVIMVGNTLPSLVKQMRQDTLAHLTFYNMAGNPLASTLTNTSDDRSLEVGLPQKVIASQNTESTIREFKVASVNYSEILAPWEARGGEDLGLIGTSLAQNFFTRPNRFTSLQAALIIALSVFGTVLIGTLVARKITRPLSKVVNASVQVAEGNFKVKVPSQGNDEVMVLAHAFNYMITGLQEGHIYRDLLGRTVSPQVREALRKSFAKGELRLEGHNAVATVLMSDIRNFTTISEKEQPTTILAWLNEYFRELVPIITRHNGVVDKFEGDAMLAFFGILPTPMPPEASAYEACQAAVEMLAVVEKINERRRARGEPPLITGIGINTGSLTAGGLGTIDRLNYTIIGDTVNTTQRMESLTRQFGESGVVVGQFTLNALQGRRGDFSFEPLGEHSLRGKSELLWVYRLRPAKTRIVQKNGRSAPDNQNEAGEGISYEVETP